MTNTMVTEKMVKRVIASCAGCDCQHCVKAVTVHLSAIPASDQQAIAIIEARLPLYTDLAAKNALKECISSIRTATLKPEGEQISGEAVERACAVIDKHYATSRVIPRDLMRKALEAALEPKP